MQEVSAKLEAYKMNITVVQEITRKWNGKIRKLSYLGWMKREIRKISWNVNQLKPDPEEDQEKMDGICGGILEDDEVRN